MENKKATVEATDKSNVTPSKKGGGLYKNLKVSEKTINIVILAAVAALFFSMFFLVKHNGFTVTFDTDGGSYVQSCKAYYGEPLTEPEAPTKEGCRFTGWYRDRSLNSPWNMQSDVVTESMTLYAGWEAAD